MFAGLIWWLARQRLANSYILRAGGVNASGVLRMELAIQNRGDGMLKIEELSVDPPLAIAVGDNGEAVLPDRAKPPIQSKQRIAYDWELKPDEGTWPSRTFGLVREGGFDACSTVSIRLHILSSFPTIRHRKKVLTAILPANVRNAQK